MTHKSQEAPLASIEDGSAIRLELRGKDIRMLANAVEVMKDFPYVSLSVLRKLAKNKRQLSRVVDMLDDEQTILQVRQIDINGPKASTYEPEELLKLRDEFNTDAQKFASVLHEVVVYTIDVSEFPNGDDPANREKFNGIKTVNQQPVTYASAFVDLLGYIIIED